MNDSISTPSNDIASTGTSDSKIVHDSGSPRDYELLNASLGAGTSGCLSRPIG